MAAAVSAAAADFFSSLSFPFSPSSSSPLKEAAGGNHSPAEKGAAVIGEMAKPYLLELLLALSWPPPPFRKVEVEQPPPLLRALLLPAAAAAAAAAAAVADIDASAAASSAEAPK